MTNDDKVEIGKCPFCASDNVQTSGAHGTGTVTVFCLSCGASSGDFNTEQEAIETWNTVSELMERER